VVAYYDHHMWLGMLGTLYINLYLKTLQS